MLFSLFRRSIDFLLFSNIYVSISASLLTATTFIVLGVAVSFSFVFFVFFSTLLFYNAQRIALSHRYQSKSSSVRHQWIVANKKSIYIISVLSFLSIFICLLFIDFTIILLFLPFAIFSLFYFLPFFNLRSILGVKALMVAFVWAAVTVSFPYIISSTNENWLLRLSFLLQTKHVLLFFERLFYVLPLAIIFNVRDINHDKENGVKTLPVLYGAKTTRIVSLICVILFIVIVLIEMSNLYYSLTTTCLLVVSGAISMVLLLFNREWSNEYYYVFAIDGMLLVQAVFIIM